MIQIKPHAINFLLRVLRYGVIGVGNSIVYSLCVLFLVDELNVHSATLASVLAFAAVLPAAYLAHRRVTFFDAASDSSQLPRFLTSTGAAFLIATGGMYVVTEIYARSYLIGIILNWILIPPINFLIYLFWVFRVGMPRVDSIGPIDRSLLADPASTFARRNTRTDRGKNA